MSWDLDLCVDYRGEPFIPFYYFITPKPSSTPALRSFPRFADLPPDLHLIIFQCCDSPTLFQLMHTCSYTRHECAKLFWSQFADVWYHLGLGAIKQYDQHRVGLVRHNRDFARYTRQVELHLGRMEWKFGDHVETRARQLWGTIDELFPCAEKVVLSGAVPYRALPPPDGEYDVEYSAISQVVDMSPPHITCFVALQPTCPQPMTLWRIAPGSSWRVVVEYWCPKRILMPTSRLPSGLLADLMSMTTKCKFFRLGRDGVDWLKAETYIRYGDGPEIECPNEECYTKFSPDEWREHMRTGFHWRSGSSRREGGFPCYRNTPVHVRAALEAREEHLEELKAAVRSVWGKLKKEFGHNNTETNRRFKNTFFAQMKEHRFLVPDETDLSKSDWYFHAVESKFDDSSCFYSGLPFSHD
ncbi:hypothetical protein BDW59DRAFT_166838 [Aspergillus cavernicola]|uniref:C2H2-type domain-containing protein n=1 Tax=Aspergillus cavernicola TaxID=176166 RepID=A0ABR4HIK9_9EURO